MNRLYLLIIGSICWLTACNPTEVSTSEELQAYAVEPSNGLHLEEKTTNGLLASATIRPSDLVAWQEWQAGKNQPWDSLSMKYDKYLYVIFTMSSEGKDVLSQLQGTPLYAELLQVFSFRMGAYTSLHLSDGATVPLMDAVYARTYGMASGTSVLLAFERPEQLTNIDWLELRVKELGLKTGQLKFRFESQDLLNIPELEISPSI